MAPRDRKYLSVHLDTSPDRTIGQAYETWFRDAIRRLRDELGDVDRTERDQFDRATGAAESVVRDQASRETAGLAVYIDGTGEFEMAVPLPMSPLDLVTWTEYPALGPLVDVIDEQERVVVLLIDKERTRLFTIFLGEIEERTVFFDEVPGKQATGDWFGLSQKRYQRHHEDKVLQHVKRTIRAMMDELRERPFDRLLVSGPDEAVTTLIQRLPRPLRDRLAGTFEIELFATDAEVLAAGMREAEAAERRYEVDEIRKLLEASTGQNAAVGADATLAVLNDGRVHRLFIARHLDVEGGECTTCERLTLDGETCPICGSALQHIRSVGDRAIAHALAQGARVEVVAGEASDLLREHGGMAAWTRY
jgi:peptide chain release factor subunit 1